MEVMQVLHMNNGEGETSYAKNSNIQRKIISETNSSLKEAILNIMCNNKEVPEGIGIADLGCSSGPNTLMVVTEIINIIYATCRKSGSSFPELRISLNDLPGNDFNYIFRSLPAFFQKVKEEKGAENCYVVGVPGSFYGRIFPRKSLHFVHSSSSLHWLSQVPVGLATNARTTLNKGKLYISQTSPSDVIKAYVSQFQNDFSSFLRSRSPEMVPGGRMLLSLMGRSSIDPTIEDGCYYQWELLAHALSTLVSKGLVEDEKIDSFNAPYYAPCPEELKIAVEKEGSFIVNRIEAFEIGWDASVSSNSSTQCEDKKILLLSMGQQVAKTIRAVVESMVENHFGNEIMDDLFSVYGDLVDDYLYKKRAVYVNLVVSLTRKD
ncbi:Jasmonate O-methyltransferase [Capsicum annuum]|uniref:probable jasmonic acid carboxyl methyltransferase 2 n=1 Tax=Capsicum annuum TaxID=4072 RepID=UPI0007BF40E0|nr:probable jasmonic acid carboxyl methyltransferase 2 [Capsicum annuum]KAF3629364.1 Jasmonate O-methyltransferase [Capsicum annuum]KAF3629750.1 Jasmonate O-methyltransferase [Capsicum annuum]